MKKDAMFNSKKFNGCLSKNEHKLPIEFSVLVDESGEAKISLGTLKRTPATKFISEYFHKTGSRFENFCLEGVSEDGVTFNCDDLIILSMGNFIFEDGSSFAPVVQYSMARLTMTIEPIELPIMSWKLKNFQAFGPLSSTTHLGNVEMIGSRDQTATNAITGYLTICATTSPADVGKWRVDADNLCEHLVHVMSFAGNVRLSYPIINFSYRDKADIQLFSRSAPKFGVWPPFSHLDLRPIFEHGIEAHINPTLDVKNLPFAIEWFNMNGVHSEANLITSMTVLENIIDSNLAEDDTYLINDAKFKLLKRKLSAQIKDDVATWTESLEQQKILIAEFSGKLNELKRRSLMDKIRILGLRWGVNLEGIDEGHIKAAKSARDHVVHRGQYIAKDSEARNLHDHLLIIREVVVRFILTAIGFDGQYVSYLNGSKLVEYKSLKLKGRDEDTGIVT